MPFQPTTRDLGFVEWLKTHEREGYVEAFLNLQEHQPRVLSGLSDQDWIDIFLKLQPAGPDQAVDLCSMFSSSLSL